MKFFISHQKVDSETARLVASELRSLGQESYLDDLDHNLGKSGDDLATYLRDELAKCDVLLAVVSAATQLSWWVPWEIGVASEKGHPLSTYLVGGGRPPEYLRKWPLLVSTSQLASLVLRAGEVGSRRVELTERHHIAFSDARHQAAREFHTNLKADLRQG